MGVVDDGVFEGLVTGAVAGADVLSRVAAAAAAVAAARATFDAAHQVLECAVDEAVVAGFSNRRVAEVADMSHTGVAKVLERLPRQAAAWSLARVEGRWVRFPAGAAPVMTGVGDGVGSGAGDGAGEVVGGADGRLPLVFGEELR